MKKLIVLGVGAAVVGAAASTAIFGAGTAAAAPDVVGMKYEDALQEIKDAGGRARIVTRVGDQLEEDQCIVTNVWDSSFLRVTRADRDEMSVALNCAGGYATATSPGASIASPLGREAKLEADREAWKARREAAQLEEQELAEAATPDE